MLYPVLCAVRIRDSLNQKSLNRFYKRLRVAVWGFMGGQEGQEG